MSKIAIAILIGAVFVYLNNKRFRQKITNWKREHDQNK